MRPVRLVPGSQPRFLLLVLLLPVDAYAAAESALRPSAL